MIEELKLLQSILGDLSSVGGWVAAGIIGYKLIVNMTMIIGAGWLLKAVASMIYSHVKSDITRSEANDIKAESTRAKADNEVRVTALESKLEKVKHMYKILKESKELKDNE